MFLNLFSSFIKLFLQVVIDNKSAHTFGGQLTSPRTERPAHALGEVFIDNKKHKWCDGAMVRCLKRTTGI